MSVLGSARTFLFTPGNRPDRFQKAIRSAADPIILDLEDSVAATARPEARLAITEFVRNTAPGRLLVRINPVGSSDFPTDVEMLGALSSEAPGMLAGVVVPKAEGAGAIEAAAQAAGGVPVLGLIESVKGLYAANEILTCSVESRLAFGALDFTLDVGGGACALLDSARIHLVLQSRLAAAVAPVDSPSENISDPNAVGRSARNAAELGMGGMLAIHPTQLSEISAAFAPSNNHVAWARSVLVGGDDAVKVDGKMVDAPVLTRARQILEKAQVDT